MGRECSTAQHVVIEYWESGICRATYSLPENTGNPVIWPHDNNKAILMYSCFEDADGRGNRPVSPVQRWMFCSNWISEISFSDNKINRGLEIRLDIPESIGYLGRCQPIKQNNWWYLPLYRELNPYSVIVAFRGTEYKRLGVIGQGMDIQSGRFGVGAAIQPTLWFANGKMKALCRDVTTRGYAWFSESSDNGLTWTDPVQTMIRNTNNSLVVINEPGENNPFIIWNSGADRHSISFGRLNDDYSASELFKLGSGAATSYSYPNYCFDKLGRLHIVHTATPFILHHVFTKNQQKALKDDRQTIVAVPETASR